MAAIDLVALTAVAARIKSGMEFCGSKWGQTEAEVIALQTLSASSANRVKYGDAFSWVGGGLLGGRRVCGTDNRRGLQLLIDDGCVVVEDYTGSLACPPGTATRNGVPQVLRVTNKLVQYAEQFFPNRSA